MLHADVWGAVADHSGDSYFDVLYAGDWPNNPEPDVAGP